MPFWRGGLTARDTEQTRTFAEILKLRGIEMITKHKLVRRM